MPIYYMPLVTVIIPVYCVQSYIRQCIDSVLSQTYKNLEILCIDDCGSDASISILRMVAKDDKRVKIIRHSNNLGLGEARNTGIKLASGDYLFFLDSDDWIRQEAIEKLVDAANRYHADIIIGSGQAFTDEKCLEVVARNINRSLFKSFSVDCLIDLQNFQIMISELPCVAWGKLFKKEFVIKNRLRFIGNKIYHEDNGFHVKCMACMPRVTALPFPGYQYRIRSSSIMDFGRQRNENMQKHMRISIQDALDYFDISNIDQKYCRAVKDVYWKVFCYKRFGITFYWGSTVKIIKIGRISLLKQLYEHGRVSLQIFGLKVRNNILLF